MQELSGSVISVREAFSRARVWRFLTASGTIRPATHISNASETRNQQ